MTEPRIAYTERPDIRPEAESSVLANIYRLVLDCHARKEATPKNRPDDGTKIKEASANEHHSR